MVKGAGQANLVVSEGLEVEVVSLALRAGIGDHDCDRPSPIAIAASLRMRVTGQLLWLL